VRELFNVIQRAAMLCEGTEITREDLAIRSGLAAPDRSVGHVPAGVPGELVFNFESGPHTAEEVERMLMLQALEHTRGNVSKAARLIGMQRSSFRYRIERYSLEEQVREIVER
jgi:two-component system response regulator PilR (NtrC family)